MRLILISCVVFTQILEAALQAPLETALQAPPETWKRNADAQKPYALEKGTFDSRDCGEDDRSYEFEWVDANRHQWPLMEKEELCTIGLSEVT